MPQGAEWWRPLLQLLLDTVLGWLREEGRQEVRDEINRESQQTKERHDRIDARPADPDAAIERLRARRRAAGKSPDEDRGPDSVS